MKNRLIFIILILCAASVILIFSLVSMRNQPDTFTYDSPQWHLPEGAKARIGKGDISKIKYSPDGTLLAGISPIGIWLYDVQTGEPRSLLAGHTDTIYDLTFSTDGKMLASASEDGSIRLWDVIAGECKQTFIGDIFGFDNVTFSSDGKTLIGAGFHEINIWDVATSMHIKTLQEQFYADGGYSKFSLDGKLLACPRGGDSILLWDVTTGKEKQSITDLNRRVESIEFSPDGNTLASGGYGDSIILWDTKTGKQEQILKRHNKNFTFTFSPDGKTLASGSSDKTISLWDTNTGKRKKTFKGPELYFSGVAFSPDGKTLTGAGWNDSVGNVLIFWDVMTGDQKKIIRHNIDQYSVSFSPDGTTFASGGANGSILMWDRVTGKHKKTLKGHKRIVSSLAFSPDGKILASKGWDETVILWDIGTGKRLKKIRGGMSSASNISLSPDGATFVNSGYNGKVNLFDAATGKLKQTLIVHKNSVKNVEFSPDGNTLASMSINLDGKIYIWNFTTDTYRQKQTYQKAKGIFYNIAYSPDGKTLASAEGLGKRHFSGAAGMIRLWNVESDGYKKTFRLQNKVLCVSFSPDGETLACGDLGSNVHLWDVATGKQIKILKGHTDGVDNISFSPDGKTLASRSYDGTILLWDLTSTVNP